MKLSNLKIGTRLGAGFTLILLVLCTMAGIAMFEMSRLNASIVDLGTNWMPSLREAMVTARVLCA